MVKVQIILFLFFVTLRSFANMGGGIGSAVLTEELLADGHVIQAFYSHLWENTEDDGTVINPTEKIDNFLNENQQAIVNSGLSNEIILGEYLKDTYRESELAVYQGWGSDQEISDDERYQNYEALSQYFQESYPKMKEKIQEINEVKNKFNEFKENAEDLSSYYLNEENPEVRDLALRIIMEKEYRGRDAPPLSAQTKLRMVDKLNENIPDEFKGHAVLSGVLSSIPNGHNGKLLTSDNLEFGKGLLSKIDPNKPFPIYGNDGQSENILCFDLYQHKKWVERSKEFRDPNMPSEEDLKNYNLQKSVQRYSYFKAVGADTSIKCSDGVSYKDRLKEFIQDDLEVQDHDFCSMVTMKNESPEGVENSPKTNVSELDTLEHMTAATEGLISLMDTLSVDKSVQCPSGKTIQESLEEIINKVSSMAEKLGTGAINLNGENSNVFDSEQKSYFSCTTTLEELSVSDLPCDISNIIDKLAISLELAEEKLKDKPFTQEYTEINSDYFWGKYPYNETQEDCYLTSIARFKNGKVEYDLKVRVKGINFHVRVQKLDRHLMLNYLKGIKSIMESNAKN